MANIITADLFTQVMTCRVCGEQTEIPRKLLRDQHQLMILVDETAADHKECAEHPDNPDLARLSREFRKRVRREERKVDERLKRAA